MSNVETTVDGPGAFAGGVGKLVVPLDQLTLEDISRVGGKNASLGEMLRELAGVGVRVPGGFALSVDAYHLHLQRAGIDAAIYDELDQLDVTDTQSLAATDDEALQLAKWALAIEDHYSSRAGHPAPMDLEWAKDGKTNELFILQARPETIHSQQHTPRIELFKLKAKGEVLVRGKAVGNRIGAGAVRVIHSTSDLHHFQSGEVIVAEMTDPDWEPVLKRAAAVITEHGGRTCHAAIVSRELGIPCVVGSGNAMEVLRDGQDVTVCCAEGDDGRVYEGLLEYDRQELDPATLPTPPVPLMLTDPHAYRRLYKPS